MKNLINNIGLIGNFLIWSTLIILLTTLLPYTILIRMPLNVLGISLVAILTMSINLYFKKLCK